VVVQFRELRGVSHEEYCLSQFVQLARLARGLRDFASHLLVYGGSAFVKRPDTSQALEQSRWHYVEVRKCT